MCTGSFLVFLFTCQKKNVIDNSDENIDEIDIKAISAVDGKIVSVHALRRIDDFLDIVHIDSRYKKNKGKADKVDNPVNHLNAKEQVDQGHDHHSDKSSDDNRNGSIHMFGEHSNDTHQYEASSRRKEGNGDCR